jgi:hypothetical protein
MSDSNRVADFRGNNNLHRTLRYRPHIRIYYQALLIGCFLEPFLFAPGIIHNLKNGDQIAALKYTIITLGISALMWLQARFLLKPLAQFQVHVDGDRLILDRMGQKIEVHFSQAKEVKFSHLPYFGGWFELVLQSGASYRFTVVLERSIYIIDALIAYNGSLINNENALRYRQTAIESDQSWGRLYLKWRAPYRLSFKYLIWPLLTFTVYYFIKIRSTEDDNLPLFIFGWLAFHILLGISIYVIAELILITRTRNSLKLNPNAFIRDLKIETWVYRSADALYLLLSAGVLAVQTFIGN